MKKLKKRLELQEKLLQLMYERMNEELKKKYNETAEKK